MATFDFRILLETVEGKKFSYYSSSFVDTSTDLVLSASQVYNRITGSVSASYQNTSIFSGSNVNTSYLFKDNSYLSTSLDGDKNTGTIIFTTLDTEYDRLLRYKFMGSQKVCNVLGLPSEQWVYVDQIRLPVDDEANYFQGNIKATNIHVDDTITFANTSTLNSDLPILIDTGSDRYIKFVDTRGVPENALIMGYDVDTDKYEIVASTDFTFDISNVDNIGIGTSSINSNPQLYIKGGSDASLATKDSGFIILDQGTYNMILDENEIMARTGTSTSNLLLQHEGGNVITNHGAGNFMIGDTGESGTDILSFTPPAKLTVVGDISSSGTIHANALNVTHFTSSFITSSTIQTEGSNIFGDTIADTHTFNGHITASGNISSSGEITAEQFRLKDNEQFYFSTDNNEFIYGDGTQLFLATGGTTRQYLQDDGVWFTGNITASGNISSSGTGTNYFGGDVRLDGSGKDLTLWNSNQQINLFGSDGIGKHFIGYSSGLKLSSYNNITLNTLDDEIRFQYGSSERAKISDFGLSVTGDITASGNISSSGAIKGGSLDINGNADFGDGNITNVGNIELDAILDDATGGDTRLTLADTSMVAKVEDTEVVSLVAGKATFTGDISASGVISSSRLYVNVDGSSGYQDYILQVQEDRANKFTVDGGGNISPAGTLYIPQYITHTGDTDTGLEFTTNQIYFKAGNSGFYLNNGHITANGNISASGDTHIFGGNVGIGTATPEKPLHVSGSILVGNSNYDGIHISSSARVSSIKIGDDGDLRFNPDQSLKLRLYRSSGNLETYAQKVYPHTNNYTDLGSTAAMFKDLKLAGDITASGNISSSGTITGNSIVGTLTGTATGLAGTPDIIVGSLTATSITSSIVTSSIIYTEGSNIFGDADDDTHQFTGSLETTGSTVQFNTPNAIINANSYTDAGLLINDDIYDYRFGTNPPTRRSNYIHIGRSSSHTVFNNSAGSFKFRVGGADKVVFDSSGNITTVNDITTSGNISGSATSTGSFGAGYIDNKLGIGTSSPEANLHIYQDSPSANQVLFKIGTSDDSSRVTIDEDGDITTDGNLIVHGTSGVYANKFKSWSDATTTQFGGGGPIQFTTGNTIQWNVGLDGSLSGSAGNHISASATSTGSFGYGYFTNNLVVEDRIWLKGLNGTRYIDTGWDAIATNASLSLYSHPTITMYNNGKITSLGTFTLQPGSGGVQVVGDISASGHITASGNISASGILDASGVTDGLAAAIVAEIDNDEISGDKIEGGTIGSVTITDLTATSLNVTHFTSSFITSSTIQTEGSNIFGDTIADTHQFNGHITASGNISASGDITADNLESTTLRSTTTSFNIYPNSGNDNGRIQAGQSDTIFYQTIRPSTDNSKKLGSPSYKWSELNVNQITASGNISSSGTITMLTASIGGGIFTSASLAAGGGGGGGSGTVTSIVAGDGLNGGTITSTGTISVDSASMGGFYSASMNDFTTTGFIKGNHITASGNISASGDGLFDSVKLNNGDSSNMALDFQGSNPTGLFYDGTNFTWRREGSTALSFAVGNLTFGGGGNSKISAVTNTSVTVRGGTTNTVFNTTGITTEGNISSSGNIISNQITSSGFNLIGTGTAELEVAGHITASGNISSSGTIVANELQDTSLTAGRVAFVGTNGVLTDDSDLTFATDTLTATKIGAFTLTGKLTGGSTEIEGSNFDIDGGAIDGAVIGGNSPAAGTFTTLDATSLNVTSITSSIVTSSILQTEGSNIFGDTIADTHTFNGHITASGNISSSGTITGNELKISATTEIGADDSTINRDLSVGRNISLAAALVHTGDIGTKIAFTTEKIESTADSISLVGNVTASGDISSSGVGTFGSLDISGNIDVDGTTNLDTVDIDGDVSLAGDLDFDTSAGRDITFGDNLGAALEFKEAGNLYMRFVTTNGSEGVTLNKGLTATSATFSNNITANGNIVGDGSTDIYGINNISASGHITASGNISSSGTLLGNSLTLGGTAITSTGTELNIVDGGTVASNITPQDADRVVYNDGGVMKQVTMTKLASYFDDEITNMPNLADIGTDLTVAGNITATSLNVTSITSSIVTSSILQTEGSNIFGDTIADTHTFNGHITASGNISASGGNLLLGGGTIDLKNTGTQSNIKLYCESSNAHYVKLQAPEHSEFSGNVTVTLPPTTDTLVGKTTTDTLTNKTLTSPDIDGGTIDNSVIGGNTATVGTFSVLTGVNITGSGNISGSGTGSFASLTVGGTSYLGNPTTLVELDESTDATDDKIILWDQNASLWKYMTLDNLQDSIDTTGGGGGGISFDGSTPNGVTTFKDADEVTVESNLTFDGSVLNVTGNITASGGFHVSSSGNVMINSDNIGSMATHLGALSVNYGNDTQLTGSLGIVGDGYGDIVKIGGTTTIKGNMYYLDTDATWTLTNATDDSAGADKLLAIALGTNSDIDGMLLKGFVHLNPAGTIVVGAAVYMRAGTGATTFAKDTATGNINRIVGYGLSLDGHIYFNPDSTWVEHS